MKETKKETKENKLYKGTQWKAQDCLIQRMCFQS